MRIPVKYFRKLIGNNFNFSLKDDEALKKQELIQEHTMKEDEIRKQFEDKLRSFQEEKTKHILERQSGEHEIKALKDEIRSLHVS